MPEVFYIKVENRDMKTEKKQITIFLLKMWIFIVIFIGLFAVVNKVFLVKSENVYNYINFSNQPENSIDILVLGSSHSMDGIDAKELDLILLEEYGIVAKSFNMSITGMRLEQIGYRFKEALKTQKPSVLIIETFSCAPQSTGTNESINRWALDYVPLSKEKVQYIREDIEDNLKTSFGVPFIKYHSRWRELTKEDWEILSWEKTWNRSVNQGFIAPDKPNFEGTADDYFEQDFALITEENVLPENYQEDIKEIIETCNEIGCKILFLSIPYKVQADFRAEELVKYNNYLEKQYVDNQNVYMYDMQKSVQSLQWGYEHMTDEGHVNNLGRAVVNEKLAGEIYKIWEE